MRLFHKYLKVPRSHFKQKAKCDLWFCSFPSFGTKVALCSTSNVQVLFSKKEDKSLESRSLQQVGMWVKKFILLPDRFDRFKSYSIWKCLWSQWIWTEASVSLKTKLLTAAFTGWGFDAQNKEFRWSFTSSLWPVELHICKLQQSETFPTHCWDGTYSCFRYFRLSSQKHWASHLTLSETDSTSTETSADVNTPLCC